MKNIFNLSALILLVVSFNSCVDDKFGTPVLTTTEVTKITRLSAISGGEITDDGGSEIISRGVCWNKDHEPTITNDKTVDSAGIGSFTSNLQDLYPNTTYNVRAYATNSNGTSYGITKTFTTLIFDFPTVRTNPVSLVTASSCHTGGYISDYGGSVSTNFGVCWSTNHNPTISDNKVTTGSLQTGHFTVNIGGLSPSTTYYIRAFANNSVGVGYGDEVSFTTLSGKGEGF